MRFNSETGKRARAAMQGYGRAAFWRAQGFPQLAKGRATIAANRARRKAEAEALQAQSSDRPKDD